MEGRAEETCRGILAEMMSLPRGSDLSPHIHQFQQYLWSRDIRMAKGDRIVTIFLELAADLERYDHDPIVCQENPYYLNDDVAIEKVRETLDALQNITTAMPWLKKN